MNVYGTPTGAATFSRAPGAAFAQHARRAIAAAKGSTGWRRQSYLQEAVKHLNDADRAFSSNGQNAEQLIDATCEFVSACTAQELEAAVAQTVNYART